MTDLISNRAAVDLAQAAYGSTPDIVGPLEVHPIRIHFHENDGVTYVVMEGSAKKADWIDNFRIWADPFLPRVNHGDGFIPEGFYISVKSVLDEVVGKIWSRLFCLVGHSRGGAQAAVMAKLLLDRGAIARKIYLLEPARAFIFSLPPELVSLTWGVWNGNDPVPHLPIGAQFSLQLVGRPALDPFDCHHLASVGSALDAVV
jgi:Lipase (class 3)